MDWLDLDSDLPADLVAKVRGFESPRPGAEKPCEWLRKHALDSDPQARTRVAFGGGEVLGFFTVTAGETALTEEQAERCGLRYTTVPSVVVRWLAAGREPGVGAKEIVAEAMTQALRARKFVGASILAVDVQGKEAKRFWSEREGFDLNDRDAGPKTRTYRYWTPLPTFN